MMEEPRRLAERDPFIGRLIASGRRERADEGSRARAIALVGVGASTGAVVATSKSSSLAIAAAKATFIVLAFAGGATLAARSVEAPERAAPIVEIAVVVPASATTPLVVAPVETVVAPAPTPSAPPRVAPKKIVATTTSSSAEPVVDDPSAELAFVSAAHAALKSGDAAGALARIATWRKQFKGVYAEEAEAIHVDALVASGARDAAKERAAAFVARWPKSPHAARMRAVANP